MRYSTEYYVLFLGRLIDTLGLEKVSLVGTSLGGAISLGFSLENPQRVEKLVLVDGHGLGREISWRVMSYIMVRSPLLNRLVWAALRRSRGMVEWSLQSIFYDPPDRYGEPRGQSLSTGEETGSGKSLEVLAERRDRVERPSHQLR